MRRALHRLRRPPVALAGVLMLLLAAFDAVITTPGWPWAVVLGVPVLAVAASASRDVARRGTLAAAAVALSVAGTAVLASTVYHWMGTWGLAESAALLLLLISLWRCARRRRDWVLVASLAAAVLAQSLRIGVGEGPVFAALLAVAVSVATSVGVALRGVDGQHRAAVAAVRRAEREEVARELHDVVAHHVTGIVVMTQAVRAVAACDPHPLPAEISSALASVEAAGTDALASMRRLVGVLRTDDSAGASPLPSPGLAGLEDLVRRFRATGAVGEVELRVEGEDTGLPADIPEQVPAEVQAGAYRVVQECLTNIRRHAPGAALAQVRVTCSAAAVTVCVTNSAGRAGAAAAPAGGGFGVLGMHERVTALGGELAAGPQRDGGWVIRAHLPTSSTTSPVTSAAAGSTAGAASGQG